MGNTIKPNIDHAEKTGVLQLAQQKLEKVPEEIIPLQKNLRTLDLSKNKILILPTWINQFKFLKSLTLDENRLTSLPVDIGSLVKLETLSVSQNRLVSLPPSLSQLKMLKVVNFSCNRLTTFPIQLCSGLDHLDAVDLSRNQITAVPEEIRGLQVIELNLNQNQISALSERLSECPRLKVVRLEENCLPLSVFTEAIMKQSKISLFVVEGNVFQMRDFHQLDGYNDYMERYTATKKKAG